MALAGAKYELSPDRLDAIAAGSGASMSLVHGESRIALWPKA